MKIKKLLILSAFVAGSAATVSAAINVGDIIGVDFGNDDGTTLNWNNLGPINGDIAAGSLIDIDGDILTGVSFTTDGATGENGSSEFSSSFSSIGATAQGDWWFESSSGSGFTLTFDGLDDSLTYDLVIGAYNADATGAQIENGSTAWTAGGITQTTVVDLEANSYVTFSGLTSTGGVLEITSGNNGSNTIGALSALTLTAIAVPEPSTYAFLGGLLAFMVVMLRRHR